MNDNKIRFIDLFAGLGGIRLGFEKIFNNLGFQTECVMTSEIKPYAVKTLKHNFEHGLFFGDIFKVANTDIPDFDFLLGGFPCQPFSAGGKRQGFLDTRGTLFFEIERILKEKQPYGFILENVEGLVRHDPEFKSDKIGRTLSTIIYKLETELGYHVSWEVLDSLNFGLPQSRKRIFIVGAKDEKVKLNRFEPRYGKLKDILEQNLETIQSDFITKILTHFEINELYGKSIKDKRGGDNNIHSWDIGLKGEVSQEQSLLLSQLFKERRKKHWAEQIGITWMDGMPLTLNQIQSFHKPTLFDSNINLKEMLDDLVEKGYLRFEHPKKIVEEQTENGVRTYREYDTTKPKGYNIVTGKLSFEINKILDPNDIAPTLVATDVSRLAVPDGKGLRRLTTREGLRLFGYPEWYEIPTKINEAFDLLGNTVAVPVVEYVAEELAEVYIKNVFTLHQEELQCAVDSF
ncbi:MAG: DNA (cytosine-5-)-methyltransferase [Spirosomaceae bacterium]|nr:DNA (cytosine-5-)-methyltransferase [Spirosomataceae bacterium]